MSSSNRVRLAFIEESTYGETPGVGNFETARFVSESLSGTPETTESQQIRQDRQSSGQVVTGLTVEGAINFELAKESQLEKLIESAMFNSWVVSSPVAVDLTIDVTLKTLTRASGDFNNDVNVGDILTLSGFSNSVNNTQVQVASIDSATVVSIVFADTVVDEVGTSTSFKVADYIELGLTKKSYSIEKAFLDLADKALIYKGMIVSSMSLNIAYGELITGAFNFSGNDAYPVEVAGDFITDGRTINAAATTNTFNGSVDMPFSANSAGQSKLTKDAFCIQSIGIELNNNLTPTNCIGKKAPINYSEGTAQVGINLTAYNEDESWSLLSQKIEQTPFEVGFLLKYAAGFYGFYIPAVQVSGSDPASSGANQDVLQELSGTAKVGSNGEKALKIFRG